MLNFPPPPNAKRAPLALIRGVLLLGLFLTAVAARAGNPTVDPFLAADQIAFATDKPVVHLAQMPGDYNPNAQLVSGYQTATTYDPHATEVGLAAYAGDYCNSCGAWGWTVLPEGLIYHSYQAGPRESRISLHAMHNETRPLRSESLWDATLGGRRGILRFGNHDPANPVGWQLDIEGAAMVRLNIDEERDLDASDFRFGVPLTYTDGGKVSYKFGYYHLSSHLGDELIARTGASRINYVRDAIIMGASYQATPYLRLYGETAYAFFTAGGAEPWEFQFGAEYSRPGTTGVYGTPFVATNAHLREETDFSGDWTLQTGWLWRNDIGNTLRLGLHYMNGKSTLYQFFARNEEQIGFGIWYDY